jgi:hypothetical protein
MRNSTALIITFENLHLFQIESPDCLPVTNSSMRPGRFHAMSLHAEQLSRKYE